MIKEGKPSTGEKNGSYPGCDSFGFYASEGLTLPATEFPSQLVSVLLVNKYEGWLLDWLVPYVSVK